MRKPVAVLGLFSLTALAALSGAAAPGSPRTATAKAAAADNPIQWGVPRIVDPGAVRVREVGEFRSLVLARKHLPEPRWALLCSLVQDFGN